MFSKAVLNRSFIGKARHVSRLPADALLASVRPKLVDQRSLSLSKLSLSKEAMGVRLNGIKERLPHIYLDSTASHSPDKAVLAEVMKFIEMAYANTHSAGHWRAMVSTDAVHQSRDALGRLFNYDPQKDVVIFKGNGATGPANYLAQLLASEKNLDRPYVISTAMEHHANQLPWANAKTLFVNVDAQTGELDMEHLEALLENYGDQTRLLTVSGASNVTGIRNDIQTMAKKAHDKGIEVCLDAAQLAPHFPIDKNPIHGEPIDYILVSPHKMGAPGSPGVLIANKSLIEAQRHCHETGGGVVNAVSLDPLGFTSTNDLAEGEEPGTPNVPGILSAGLIAIKLKENMSRYVQQEQQLLTKLIHQLERLDSIEIIGDSDPSKRVGVVSFQVRGVHHAVVTAYLNDHNVAVRNGCFCAQPYVANLMALSKEDMAYYTQQMEEGDRRELPGYVRISLSHDNSEQDVEAVVSLLRELVYEKEKVNALYEVELDGTAKRRDGKIIEPLWTFEQAKASVLKDG